MKEKIIAKDVAESFINGNLSWVKEKCKKDVQLVNEVICELDMINKKERERFMKWVMMW